MDQDSIKNLLDRYLAGTCTLEEKQRVEAWLEQVNRKDAGWSEMTAEARKRYLAVLYRDIAHTIKEQAVKEKPAYYIFARAAAAVLLLIGFSVVLYKFGPALLEQPQEAGSTMGAAPGNEDAAQVTTIHYTPAGKTRRIRLSDGTLVWLNAASSIRYPEQFEEDTREVHLEGEAFFEVAPDKKKPFIIHTGDMQTRVLGTSFNIKAYRGEDIQVAVATGKVEVSLPDGEGRSQQKLLLPNQLATYKKTAGLLDAVEISDAGSYAAWKEGRLMFRHTPIQEVAATLERSLGLQIDILNPGILACKITGRFDRNQPAETTIEAICKSIDAEYTIRDNRVNITGPGCR